MIKKFAINIYFSNGMINNVSKYYFNDNGFIPKSNERNTYILYKNEEELNKGLLKWNKILSISKNLNNDKLQVMFGLNRIMFLVDTYVAQADQSIKDKWIGISIHMSRETVAYLNGIKVVEVEQFRNEFFTVFKSLPKHIRIAYRNWIKIAKKLNPKDPVVSLFDNVEKYEVNMEHLDAIDKELGFKPTTPHEDK